MAYGMDSRWAGQEWGLGLIMLSRRLQWPLIAVSLIFSVSLLALVISGKRRIWWLIGLAPVLALFAHRFVTAPINRYDIADQPAFVLADQATFLQADDFVAGVSFADHAYAFPYACLFETPVIVLSDRDQRMLLMWSPYANAATALSVALELKARDLDIASEPADGLLIYNARRGEFIAAVTGRTPGGEVPVGVKARVPVTKMTWKQWKAKHGETRVMLPRDGSYDGPTGPVIRGHDELVCLVGDVPVLALRMDAITSEPMNETGGDVPVLVFRDPASGTVRAFDRRIEADLIPQFRINPDSHRRKGAAFIDSDTDSGWTHAGVATDGASRGKRLSPVLVQEDVWSRAALYWHPHVRRPIPDLIK